MYIVVMSLTVFDRNMKNLYHQSHLLPENNAHVSAL